MHTAIGPVEVWRHHCFNFWMAFVVPPFAPVTRLVGVGWVIPAAVATALPPCSLIETLTPVLVSPVLIIPSARMTRWLPVITPPPIACALVACIGLLSLFLSKSFALLAQPFLREVPSID